MIQALTWLNMRVKQVGAEETLAGGVYSRDGKEQSRRPANRVLSYPNRGHLRLLSVAVSTFERELGMHAEISRRQFLARGGTAALGVGLAGSLLAGCGGGGAGSGQVTYWSNLEGVGAAGLLQEEHREALREGEQGH